jgi:shikimate 5-dehydrogenase
LDLAIIPLVESLNETTSISLSLKLVYILGAGGKAKTLAQPLSWATYSKLISSSDGS